VGPDLDAVRQNIYDRALEDILRTSNISTERLPPYGSIKSLFGILCVTLNNISALGVQKSYVISVVDSVYGSEENQIERIRTRDVAEVSSPRNVPDSLQLVFTSPDLAESR
jgi:hypothetical protein